MIVLLIHGWGFDASFWKPLRGALEDIESVAWDLGFLGRPDYSPLPQGRPVVAVGHSFGLLWLLHERPIDWRAVVSINGFPRFARGPDFPDGVPSRILSRMISRFGDSPAAVHREFMTRCGADGECHGDLAVSALSAGLSGMAEWDERGKRVDLVLAGRADPIAPVALTETAFAGQTIEWHDGGHLLPLQAPEWCAQRLRDLWEKQ